MLSPEWEKPTPEEVRAQLTRMLKSSAFNVPERLKLFLSFVVNETLAGNTQEIKAYSIALAAFGRNENFDPQLDPIVRIEAGKLRKALELYFLNQPSDKVKISIPKGTYVPVFSYAKNSTRNTEKNAAPKLADSLKPFLVPSGVTPLEQEQRPVLMLLPFHKRSDNNEFIEPFLSGLADNLFSQMQNNEVVHIFEASPEHLSSANLINIVALARKEGARFVLHGQSQTVDNSMRLYVALTDAKSGLRIWTEKYDIPLDHKNILELQDEITQNIFSVVLDNVGVIARTLVQEADYLSSDKLGVYESTLRYVAWVTSFDRENYVRAKHALEMNIDKDPHNPILLAQLSDIYSSDCQFAFNQIDNGLESAFDLARKALLLDPGCHTAQLAKALYFFLIKDKQQLEILLNALLNQRLNPYTKASAGLFIGMSLDLSEGKNLIKEASCENPYQPSSYNVVSFMWHFCKGEYEEALRSALQINAPYCVWDPMILTAAHTALGQKIEAEKAKARLFELEPSFKAKQKQLLSGLLFDDHKVAMIHNQLLAAGI